MFLFWFCARPAAPSVGMRVSLVAVGDNTECYAVLHSPKGRVPKKSKIEGRGSSLQMQGEKCLGALFIKDKWLDLIKLSL